MHDSFICLNLELTRQPIHPHSFIEDMYIDFGLAQETATKIKNTEQYITNVLFHNAIRIEPKDVMKKLFELSKRQKD